jgi:hypothetical protein
MSDKTRIDRAGGRKFLIALVVIACAMLARAFSGISSEQLAELLKNVLLLFGAANVGGKLVDAAKAALARIQPADRGAP